MDSGKVEYRTVAFCTHLTVSRWEPITPTTTAADQPSEGNSNVTFAQQKNDPAHAARLMSLANYIRHILSLTAGIPGAQQQQASAQPEQSRQEPHKPPKTSSAQDSNRDNASSGPGPIKSDSSRRHRYSPDYHDHSRRRHTQHQPIPQPDNSPTRPSYNSGYREGNRGFESQPQQQHYGGTSPILAAQQFPPHDQPHHSNSVPAVRSAPCFLKVPYPNLTLTLALIYVDRLKAKYPDAKGEPGCSHRLFLVAFIIAAKYRCSVELSPPMSQEADNDSQKPLIDSNDDYRGSSPLTAESEGPMASLEARLNAELIFSNHAWVRLLNLGSFYRPPLPSAASAPANAANQMPHSAPSGTATHSQTTTQEQSRYSQPSQPAHSQQLPSLASIINPAPISSSIPVSANNGILQVEDLDRMEAEFLRFLNFDLAAMSHDLETCWNLLVGKKETPA
ncbi:hypothetical protein BGX28_004769 [Mortierella sp. GBA30]|nr:hypothetical protein BGX28_004769 [Mortierella sp. GBA30]